MKEALVAVENVTWDKVRQQLLEDPEFRREYENTRWIDELIDLRLERRLTQKELAERAGTSQSAIARLESGKQEPTVRFLRRVVEALGGKLTIRIEAAEEVPQTLAEQEERPREDARAQDPAA